MKFWNDTKIYSIDCYLQWNQQNTPFPVFIFSIKFCQIFQGLKKRMPGLFQGFPGLKKFSRVFQDFQGPYELWIQLVMVSFACVQRLWGISCVCIWVYKHMYSIPVHVCMCVCSGAVNVCYMCAKHLRAITKRKAFQSWLKIKAWRKTLNSLDFDSKIVNNETFERLLQTLWSSAASGW